MTNGEIRKKPEWQSPNRTRARSADQTLSDFGLRTSDFGLRTSDFLRHSSFVIRHSSFVISRLSFVIPIKELIGGAIAPCCLNDGIQRDRLLPLLRPAQRTGSRHQRGLATV